MRIPIFAKLFSTIRGRFCLLLLLIFIPMILMQSILYWKEIREVRKDKIRWSVQTARTVSKAFVFFVENILQQEAAIGAAATVSPALRAQDLERLLARSVEATRGILSYAWVSPDGTTVASSDLRAIGAERQESVCLESIKSGRDSAMSGLFIDSRSERPTFSICRGVRGRNGMLLGIVSALIRPDHLDRILPIDAVGESRLSIIDSSGLIVYLHPFSHLEWEDRKRLSTAPQIRQALEGRDVFWTPEAKAGVAERAHVYVPIFPIGWAAGVEEEISGENIVSMLSFQFALFIGAVFCSLALGIGFSASITSPLRKLRQFTVEVGRGNLRPAIKVAGPAEIQDLTHAFIEMSKSTKSAIEAEQRAAEEARISGEVLHRELAERKQVEQALRKSEASLRSLVELSIDGIFTIASDGGFQTANPAAERLSGYTEEELRAKRFVDLCAPPFRQTTEATFARGLVTGEAAMIETTMIRKDGRQISLRIAGSPFGTDGRIEGIFCIARDTTEQKLAEARLRDSEELFRLATEAIGGLIYDADVVEGTVHRSSGLLSLLGHEPSEVPSRVEWWWDQIHPDDRREARNARIDAFSSRSPVVSCEYRMLDREGRVIWVSDSARIIYSEEGRAIRLVGCAISVDDRKKAEDALRESEKRYRHLVGALPVALYTCDSEGRLTLYNEAAEALWGRRPVIGKEFYSGSLQVFSVDGTPLPRDCVPMAVALREKRRIAGEEYVIERPDGSHAYVLSHPEPLFDRSGCIVGGVNVLVDITDRKRLEDDLRNKEKTLNTILRAAPVGVGLLKERVFLWVNQEMSDMTGYGPDELLNQSIRMLYENIPDSERGEMMYESIRETGYGSIETCWRKKNGKRINVLLSSSALDPNDLSTGVVVTALDITDHKKVEEEIIRSRNELESRVQSRTAELERANEELKQIPSKLIAAQEEERKRIGGDLHDSIGQTLAALKYHIEALLVVARRQNHPQDTIDRLDQFVTTLQASVEETRTIYMGLKPTILYELGAVAALRWYCREFLKLYPKYHVELEIGIEEENIPEPLKIVIFRITQEALNNVAKHTRAEWIDVVLRKIGSRIELLISDDGEGFDLTEVLSRRYGRSLGLTGMRERAEIMGGTFSIDSIVGEGTMIRASWPAKGQLNLPFADA
ncbi:MAG: PAS domain S-box protein [Desulfobacteraceae bacterium]|nr:PAS domain S-box protein [Desulfobacteraceae bacterium]